MGRDTRIYAIGYVSEMTGENLELLEQIAINPDNIDYGEMIDVATGPDSSVTAFTAGASKACRSSSPTPEPGPAASGSSSSTRTATRTSSNASSPTSPRSNRVVTVNPGDKMVIGIGRMVEATMARFAVG